MALMVWLVTANDIKAWTQALERLATDTNLLWESRQGIKPVRTVDMQAADLATTYNNLQR